MNNGESLYGDRPLDIVVQTYDYLMTAILVSSDVEAFFTHPGKREAAIRILAQEIDSGGL